MKFYYGIILLIIIYIYLSNANHINEPFNETKSVVNIYETVNKEMFEKIINNKSPTIFTNINTKNTSNGNIKDKIQHIFQPYIIPYAMTHNYDIQNENTDSYSPLIKQTNYRHLLLLLSGKKKIILFSPSQVSKLYTKSDISPVNFWDNNPEKFPKFETIKYLEIELEKNEMIYIPYNWWFTMYNTTKTVSVICNSESLSSYFLKS